MRIRVDMDGFGAAEAEADTSKSKAGLWGSLGFFALLFLAVSQMERGSWLDRATAPKRRAR